MNCLQCRHLDLQQYREHARVGLGKCLAQDLVGVFENFRIERDCKQFEQGEAEIVEKRVEWAARN